MLTLQSKNMIKITGIGWITEKRYGRIINKDINQRIDHRIDQKINQAGQNYADFKALASDFASNGLFAYPIKNFGRFDKVSKMVCAAVALTFNDAGIIYSESEQKETGIIGCGGAGCLQANLAYFKDYVENGRSLARGNLFIYTLPSTPLAEAAIHFGCSGPLLYVNFGQTGMLPLIEYAGDMIFRKEAPSMLAISADNSRVICMLLEPDNQVHQKKGLRIEDQSLTAMLVSLEKGIL